MKSPLIVAVVAGSSLIAGCSQDSVQIEGLSQRIAGLEDGVKQIERQVAEERTKLRKLEAECDFLAEEQGDTSAELDRIEADIDALDTQVLQYKADYRRSIQARAKGMSLPDMEAGGASYKSISVSAASDTHLTIIHASGTTKVALADAPKPIQDLFAFDPLLAAAAPGSAGAAPIDYLGIAILQGKEIAERIAIEKAERKKRPKPVKRQSVSKSQRAPTTNFTGSYYAPLQGKKPGPVSTIR